MDIKQAIKSGAKGDKKALKFLYHHYARSVLFLCKFFLKNEKKAAEAFVMVFQEVFAEIVGKPATNEQLFAAIVYGKTVAVTKNIIQQNTPEAFRDAEKNAAASPAGGITLVQPNEEQKTALLAALRGLQNRQCYTLTMTQCFAMQKHQLAKAMKLDADKIDASLSRAKESLKKALGLPENGRRELESAVRLIGEIVTQRVADTKIPADLEKQVYAEIDKAARFITAKFLKRLGISVLCVAVAALLVFGSIAIFGNKKKDDTSSGNSSTAAASEPTFSVTNHAEIVVKDYGTISLELYGEEAPETVKNFVKLANSGFYNGLTFHRIINGFMMQGGDPNGDGSGGAPDTIKGEFSENGVQNRILHTRGTISMARSGQYNSASSQFFIMHQDTESLNGAYAAFGRVTSGIEIVDEICKNTPIVENSDGLVAASNQPVITTVTIKD